MKDPETYMQRLILAQHGSGGAKMELIHTRLFGKLCLHTSKKRASIILYGNGQHKITMEIATVMTMTMPFTQEINM